MKTWRDYISETHRQRWAEDIIQSAVGQLERQTPLDDVLDEGADPAAFISEVCMDLLIEHESEERQWRSERIADACREIAVMLEERLGCTRSGSNTSEAQYVQIGDDVLRVAAHSRRPTYEALYGDVGWEVAVGQNRPEAHWHVSEADCDNHGAAVDRIIADLGLYILASANGETSIGDNHPRSYTECLADLEHIEKWAEDDPSWAGEWWVIRADTRYKGGPEYTCRVYASSGDMDRGAQ